MSKHDALLLLPPANRYQGAGQRTVMPRVLQSSCMSNINYNQLNPEFIAWVEARRKRMFKYLV